MLVLSRKGEQIQIGDDVVITVLRLNGGTVRLGVEAPDDARIIRHELDDAASQPAGDSPAAAGA